MTNEIQDCDLRLFVGGAPRSGTTLVQNILDSHPDIFGGPEFLHVPDVIELRNKMHQSVSRGYIDLYCSYEEVDDHIRSLLISFVEAAADGRSVRIISEKTPENVLVFPELLELFPEARFVHVVRDPRAVVASMLRVGRRARERGMPFGVYSRSTQSAIDYIQNCLSAGFEASAAEPGRVLTVVYERLVQFPERETKRMCDFLDISWSNDMLTPASKDHPGQKAITKEKVFYTEDEFNRNPYTDSIARWKDELSSHQKVRVTRSFAESSELKELGYDLSHADLSRLSRTVGETRYRLQAAVGSILGSMRPALRKIKNTVAG